MSLSLALELLSLGRLVFLCTRLPGSWLTVRRLGLLLLLRGEARRVLLGIELICRVKASGVRVLFTLLLWWSLFTDRRDIDGDARARERGELVLIPRWSTEGETAPLLSLGDSSSALCMSLMKEGRDATVRLRSRE